jgi:Tfp pilus assembly protein PilE
MKRTNKSMMGVTLLEIMLVLAIAALVIVMSIRFYQSASSSQKVNSMLSLVQGITAASENYFNGNSSSYTGLDNAAIASYMPNNVMPTTPWGGAITVAGASADTFTITPTGISASDCLALTNFLRTNSRFAVAAGGCVITYSQNLTAAPPSGG